MTVPVVVKDVGCGDSHSLGICVNCKTIWLFLVKLRVCQHDSPASPLPGVRWGLLLMHQVIDAREAALFSVAQKWSHKHMSSIVERKHKSWGTFIHLDYISQDQSCNCSCIFHCGWISITKLTFKKSHIE